METHDIWPEALREPLSDPLQWLEGMLLSPQHFQQNDLYWQQMALHLMAQARPHYWGLMALEIDSGAIAKGVVEIKRLRAVMPDGLVVHYPLPGQERLLKQDFSTLKAYADGETLRVYLGVPKRVPGSASPTATIRRYGEAPGTLVCDENTGDGQTEVGRLRPALELLAEEQLAPRYERIGLLELRRSGGVFTLTGYHPPLLRLEASRFLGDASLHTRLKRLANAVREKARDLAGSAEEASGAPHAAARRAVRALSAALPPLEVLVKSGGAHPFDVYMEVARLIGAVADITADPLPMELDDYRHDDAAACFEAPLGLFQSVADGLRSGYSYVPFKKLSPGLFECRLDKHWSLERLLLEVRGAPGVDAARTLAWLRRARIGCDAILPLLERRRLPGAELTEPGAEMDGVLPAQSGAVVMRLRNATLEESGRAVQVLWSGGVLRVEGPAAGAPAALVLYHLDEAPEGARSGGGG